MAWYETEALVKFECPSTISLISPSNGGKTWFVKKLLESKGMFTKPISKILYCYGSTWQPVFDEMLKSIPNINSKEDIPTENDLKELTSNTHHTCLVLDDLATQITSNPKAEELWTVHSHHLNMTIIYLAYNLFQKSRSSRTISLNTKYFILFSNLRDSLSIKHFARQAFPHQVGFFMTSYYSAVKPRWGYLVVDFHGMSDSNYRLRTNIFPGEDTVIFKPKN